MGRERELPAPRRELRPMRLLLVEDDPMIGEAVRDGLKLDGYTVDRVRDGAAADTALANGGFAAVPSSARACVRCCAAPPGREYALLVALTERPGVVLSRAPLEDRLDGWGEEVGSNAVEVHVHHLRRKVGDDVIRTVRGMGYTIPVDAGA